MRQSVENYRKPRNDSFQPGYRNSQPQAQRPLKEDTEQRIVTLYTSGQSIESITKEVGRARYLVVHVLQSRGVFANRLTEPDYEAPRSESVVVEGTVVVECMDDVKEELVAKELEPELIAVTGPDPEIAANEPPRRAKRIRKTKSPEQLKSLPTENPMHKAAAPENSPVAGRWSPLLVEALYKIVGQNELDTGMTLEDVERMLSRPKR